MDLFKTFTIIFSLISISFSQPINISGTVMDNSTLLPIVGAEIKLSRHGETATTNSEGKFSFNATSISKANLSQGKTTVPPAFHKDGTIRFSLSNDADITIQTYSLAGKQLASITCKREAGLHRIQTPIRTSGMYIHRITINDAAYTIKQMGYSDDFLVDAMKSGSSIFFSSESALGKKLAAANFPDTLRIRHKLYERNVEVLSGSVTDLKIGILAKKHRAIHTTDLLADPDDEQSLVHLLVASNEFDLPGIPVVSGCWRPTQNDDGLSKLTSIIDAYDRAYDNLKVHTKGDNVPDFITPAEMKTKIMFGQKLYGMADVGENKDSKGSDLIIEEAFKKDDPRPLWFTAWGGANTLAQALNKVKRTRTDAELKQFIAKVRVYDILGQDDAGAWIAKTYPDLIYMRAQSVYGWQESITWVGSNIRNKGEMGKVYPEKKYNYEGDSPAFFHLFNFGLNDPSEIDWGGWGGRFSWNKVTNNKCMSGNNTPTKQAVYQPFQMYEDLEGPHRYKEALYNNFAARMIWNTTSDYLKANHHPVIVINGDSTRHFIEIKGAVGTKVALDASGSYDPDNNSLSYSWEHFKESSSITTLTMEGSSSSKLTVTIPSGSGKEAHIILSVTDNGTPKLTMYRRIIVYGT
ncbi:MAG: DUF1593 domain-containing protein [Chitinispirillaceae bacterium]|nr:DUF1593 domain-containing protein [Chitinispirillaceae bacterium]